CALQLMDQIASPSYSKHACMDRRLGNAAKPACASASLCLACLVRDTTGFQPRDPLLEFPILLFQSSVSAHPPESCTGLTPRPSLTTGLHVAQADCLCCVFAIWRDVLQMVMLLDVRANVAQRAELVVGVEHVIRKVGKGYNDLFRRD